MGTTWEQIETSAMTYIKNDIDLEYDMANRPALFYNRMRAYMEMAIPFIDKPAETADKLDATTYPEFEQVVVTSEESLHDTFTINSGLIGFDICSVGVIDIDKFGEPSYEPANVISYNSTTGEITMTGVYRKGTEFTIDGYKSASFESELSLRERGLLAEGIYVAHETRFDNNLLERMVKIKDRSFNTGSEAAPMDANTRRKIQSLNTFQDHVKSFAQQTEAKKYRNSRHN